MPDLSRHSRLSHSKLSFFQNTQGKLLIIVIGWQLLLTLFGFIVSPSNGILGHMQQWDAGWYMHIIENGYGTDGSPAAPAFYPLFPLLVKTLSFITFGLVSLTLSALIINTLSLWLALLALVKIVRALQIKPSGSTFAVIALLSFPSAFFMHVFYSEALFIAIAFWAYAFALQRKWGAVGVLLAVLTASRLPSLLFVALCGLEYLRAYEWNIRKAVNKKLLWFLLAPVGLLTYGLYLYFKRGDFLAMLHAYSATNDWTYHEFNLNIFATLYETITFIVSSLASSRPTYEAFINYGLPLLALIAILLSSVYVLRKLKQQGIPLFIFGIFSIVLFTLNSNVVSVHRYALACLPIYIAVALLPKRRIIQITVVLLCLLSAGVQLFIFAKFANGMFGG